MDGRDSRRAEEEQRRRKKVAKGTIGHQDAELGVGVAAVGRRYHLAENISAGGRRPSSPARADPGPSAECDGDGIDGWMVLVLLVVLFIRASFKIRLLNI